VHDPVSSSLGVSKPVCVSPVFSGVHETAYVLLSNSPVRQLICSEEIEIFMYKSWGLDRAKPWLTALAWPSEKAKARALKPGWSSPTYKPTNPPLAGMALRV